MNVKPILYDFRSPNRFSREQFRALQMANETFARQIATVLSTTLRVVAHARLTRINQATYDEYTASLPNPSLLAVLNFAPLTGAGLFQLPMDIVMGVIDRLLGGPGTDQQPSRALSDIESGIIRNLVQRMVQELTYAYDSLAPLKATVASLESDAQFLQLSSPSTPTVVAEFELRIGEQTANATLCIPVQTLQPLLDTLNVKQPLELTGPEAEAREELRLRMDEVPVDVTVAFRPISVTSKEVLELNVGDILPLRHPTKQPLTMSADGVPVATAVPGSHGHRLACQIVTV